jgi:hypothetical protein
MATPTVPTRKPRVRYLGGTRYLIESRSQPGVGGQVDTLLLKCSCPAGKHGRRCHHLVTALAYEDWRRRQLAQTAARAEMTARHDTVA